MKKLDFIVIGAAKSATTTLHVLLKDHPEIFIPSAKEVPFFSNNKVLKKGFEKYMRNYFSISSDNHTLGTITPQYMLYENGMRPDIVANRIKDTLPDVKILAILRNPIDRSFSHYKMQTLLGYENNDFDNIINKTLNDKNFDNHIKERNNYILDSQYGEILEKYYDLFPNKNILILTTKELSISPASTIKKICRFLDVDDKFLPKNTNQKQRQGGSKSKIRILTPGFIFSIPLIKILWKNSIPEAIRKKIEYKINLWNTKPDNSKLDTSTNTYKRLGKFYKKDLAKLEKITGKKFSW